ncbi:hypothetical protein EVAR_88619_1 [Eumeta japonica]|uniref:Uncharacterized protein n=1 Tax=Eumeta variegata TaxID=151549 RepID=A0A4C1X1N4_EUMVA|nr:hypothetical protein EVAR_88619_1 [Eumeta japonica]
MIDKKNLQNEIWLMKRSARNALDHKGSDSGLEKEVSHFKQPKLTTLHETITNVSEAGEDRTETKAGQAGLVRGRSSAHSPNDTTPAPRHVAFDDFRRPTPLLFSNY